MKDNLRKTRNVGITLLALGTAFGLGVLTTAAYGVKLGVEIYTELKGELKRSNEERKREYRRY